MHILQNDPCHPTWVLSIWLAKDLWLGLGFFLEERYFFPSLGKKPPMVTVCDSDQLIVIYLIMMDL